jgi:hypothetical protein
MIPSEIDRTIKLHIKLVNAIRFAVSYYFGLAIATVNSGGGEALINQMPQTQFKPEASEPRFWWTRERGRLDDGKCLKAVRPTGCRQPSSAGVP